MKQRIGGLELAWDDAGQGQPVVLLHAFPLHRQMWAPQRAALAAGFRLIAPDLRGFGESGCPEHDSTMERMAEDLRGLLDTLGLQRVALGGLSMGGYVALAFLRAHPERVAALLLADTRAAADSEEARKNRFEMAAVAEKGGVAAVAERMLAKLLGASTQKNNPALVARVREIILQNFPPGLARAQRGMAARPDSTPLLADIRVPVLVLVGEEDAFTPPAEVRAWAAVIPGARFEVIPQAGHLSNFEQPELFNRQVQAFLSGLGK